MFSKIWKFLCPQNFRNLSKNKFLFHRSKGRIKTFVYPWKKDIFWNSRLRTMNLQSCWDHYNNLFKQWKVRIIFSKRMFFNLFLEVSHIKYIGTIKIQIGKNDWDLETYEKVRKGFIIDSKFWDKIQRWSELPAPSMIWGKPFTVANPKRWGSIDLMLS